MTKAQLFREVWLELHPGMDEEWKFQMADTVVPGIHNEEIPPDQVESMRKHCLKRGREIDSEPQQETDANLRKHLSKN